MTNLENFRATLDHRRPDQIPYYATFVNDLQRRVREHIGTDDISAHYGYFPTVSPPVRTPENPVQPDYSVYWKDEELPEGTQLNSFGVAMIPSGYYHFWGYRSPLRNAQSLKDIEDYPLPDVNGLDFESRAMEAEAIHARGDVIRGFVGHIYENAWQIRGYEEFLIDLMERPAWAECMLRKLAERARILAVGYARAGADWICCGDDVANQNALMFPPDMWREKFLPLWRHIWEDVKRVNPDAAIWYHSDGNIIEIVDDLIEAGVDILNPLQPECLDIEDIYRRHGARLTFDGTIGTQTTMPFGSPADVRDRVREVITAYGRNGGLIISPTHVLEPDVPLENIDAMADACREYGAV